MIEDRKRLWIVCELYYPEDNTTGFYMTRLAEGLAPDFNVHALCGQPNYHRRGQRAPKREARQGVQVVRVWSTTLDKNNPIFKVINMMTLSLSVFIRGLLEFRKGDRTLVVTAPPILLFAGALAALLKGASYSLLIHDNYPEMLVAAGTVRPGSSVESLYHFLNRNLYKYATRVIVVGRDMAELAEKKLAGLDVPVHVIPNWAELESVSPGDRRGNSLLSDLGLTDKFVVLYAGNMGYPQDLESILEATVLLREQKQIHFLFIGSGTKRRKFEQWIASEKPENVTLLEPRPRDEQNVFLNACDIALVSLIPKMWGVSVPSRTYNLMAAGKPLLGITEPSSEIDRLIKENSIGLNVSPHDPEAISAAIRTMEADREGLKLMGENAHRAAVERYSEALAVSRYKDVLSA